MANLIATYYEMLEVLQINGHGILPGDSAAIIFDRLIAKYLSHFILRGRSNLFVDRGNFDHRILEAFIMRCAALKVLKLEVACTSALFGSKAKCRLPPTLKAFHLHACQGRGWSLFNTETLQHVMDLNKFALHNVLYNLRMTRIAFGPSWSATGTWNAFN